MHACKSINTWLWCSFLRSNRINISWDGHKNRFPSWPRKWCQEHQWHLPKVLVTSQLAWMIVWCPKTSKMVVGQLQYYTTCCPVSDNGPCATEYHNFWCYDAALDFVGAVDIRIIQFKQFEWIWISLWVSYRHHSTKNHGILLHHGPLSLTGQQVV